MRVTDSRELPITFGVSVDRLKNWNLFMKPCCAAGRGHCWDTERSNNILWLCEYICWIHCDRLTEPFSSPALFSDVVWCGEVPTSEVDEVLLIWAKTLASPKAVARIHRTGKSIGRMGRTPFTWKTKTSPNMIKHRDNKKSDLSHNLFSTTVRGQVAGNSRKYEESLHWKECNAGRSTEGKTHTHT